ncbi:MAG: DUF4132 domain-containing protein [Sandaracinaceae bacterium]|nr:DUF4132 domain-containing protein [Sandaracinaceae bacterium]
MSDEAWLGGLELPPWRVPSWLADVEPPRTRAGAPISEDARLRLLRALERGGEDLARFRAWLEPASLREHAWALVEAWAAHGGDPRHRWVFAGLRVVSDDELEERLVPDDATAEGARAVLEQQRARLERALSTGRDWSVADWRHQLVDHPLLRHLARGLVWTADGHAFLVEDDGSLADVDQETLTLDARARVSLAHPVEMDDAALAAWGERLSDAEAVQPFAQLARPVVRPGELPGDTVSAALAELVDEASLLAAAAARGWVRGEPDERMRVRYFHKPFARPEVYAVLVIAPGLGRAASPQRVVEAFFVGRPPGGVTFESAPRVSLDRVSPVALSEVLYDLGAFG